MVIVMSNKKDEHKFRLVRASKNYDDTCSLLCEQSLLSLSVTPLSECTLRKGQYFLATHLTRCCTRCVAGFL